MCFLLMCLPLMHYFHLTPRESYARSHVCTCMTTSGGNVTASLSRCVRVISCLNLPRTDSGGEFDWGGPYSYWESGSSQHKPLCSTRDFCSRWAGLGTHQLWWWVWIGIVGVTTVSLSVCIISLPVLLHLSLSCLNEAKGYVWGDNPQT